MWVARDKDGCLSLFWDKPVRDEQTEQWLLSDNSTEVNYLREEDCQFKITWEDEPIEVLILPMSSNVFISTKSLLESTPPHCRVCSHCHCLRPKGQEVCKYYNERVEYFNKLK